MSFSYCFSWRPPADPVMVILIFMSLERYVDVEHKSSMPRHKTPRHRNPDNDYAEVGFSPIAV